MNQEPSIFIILAKKYLIFFGLSIFFMTGIYSQNEKLADSLKMIYNLGAYNTEDQLHILNLLVTSSRNPKNKIKYSKELIEKAQESNATGYLFQGYLYKGNANASQGDYKQALESYIGAANIASGEKNENNLAKVYSAMGKVYSSMGNPKSALDYYHKSLNLFKLNRDSLNYAFALENLGSHYISNKKPDAALPYLKESRTIFIALKYKKGIGYNLGNLGLVYAQKGKSEMAENYINQATKILNELEDYDQIPVFLLYMTDIYLEKGDILTASYFATQSLSLALEHRSKEQIGNAYLKLSEINEIKGKYLESLIDYKNHVIYRDSLMNYASIQQMADMRTDFEIALKQREIDLLNHQKQNQKTIVFASIIALFLISLLALGLYKRNRFIQKTNLIIEKEMNRSDHLLHNILPLETAQELKECGKVHAKKFESVTVLFTDFKEFTIHSEHLTPEQLVESVNYYFSKFDDIIGKYGLEKIKTIGDAYMCAGGLPFPCPEHPFKVIKAAFEIVKFMEKEKYSEKPGIAHFEIRLGVNTGPVVAGVVGSKKFAYDIWGDTVNVAARMESNSESGMINISENTYALVKNDFECEYRGEIDVKNKGMMKMYYVNVKKQGFYDLHHKKHSRPEPVFNEKDDIPT